VNIAVINYNAGNVRSVLFALERLGIQGNLTEDLEEIRAADGVLFPGVGEAGSAMSYLKEKKLDQAIKELKQPVLGICLGLQLLCRHSEESDTQSLGVYDHEVVKFRSKNLKVPQIGWNIVHHKKSPLFEGIGEEYFYFVHSYYADLGPQTLSKTDYGVEFSSAMQKDNFYAVQFHPEKSGDPGHRLLSNFLKLL
jgi:glutamine amidotransferase